MLPHRHFEDLSAEKGNPRGDRFPTCSSQQLQHPLSSSTKWSTPWSTQNTCQCQLCLPEAPWVTPGTAQHPFSLTSASSSTRWEWDPALTPSPSLAQRRLKKKKIKDWSTSRDDSICLWVATQRPGGSERTSVCYSTATGITFATWREGIERSPHNSRTKPLF